MEKQGLLNKIMIDNSDVDFEGISDLTPKGFDVAISLYNSGWEVEDDEIMNTLIEIYGGELSNMEGLFILCREFKLIGYSGIVESLKEYKEGGDN